MGSSPGEGRELWPCPEEHGPLSNLETCGIHSEWISGCRMDQLTDLIDLYTIHNTAKNVFVDTIIIATFEKASIIQALHDCHTSHRSHLRDSSNIVNNFQIFKIW